MKNILMKVKRWLQGWFVESIKESAETERHLAKRNLLRKVESRRMHVRMVHADEQENFRFKEDGISSTKSLLMVRIAEFVRTYYEVRFNKLSQQYELSRKGEGRWDKFDDELCCRMLMEMNSVGIAVAKPYLVRTVVHGGGLARMYHPVCAYLEGLPAWNDV